MQIKFSDFGVRRDRLRIVGIEICFHRLGLTIMQKKEKAKRFLRYFLFARVKHKMPKTGITNLMNLFLELAACEICHSYKYSIKPKMSALR